MIAKRMIAIGVALAVLAHHAAAQGVKALPMSDDAIRGLGRIDAAIRNCSAKYEPTPLGAELMDEAYRRKPELYLRAQQDLIIAAQRGDKTIDTAKMCIFADAAYDAKKMRRK